MGVVPSKAHPIDAGAKGDWNRYRSRFRQVAVTLSLVTVFVVCLLSLQLLLRYHNPAAYEAPHAYVVILCFTGIQIIVLYALSKRVYKLPLDQSRAMYLTLGVAATITRFVLMVFATVTSIAVEFRACGEFVCAISFFRVIDYIALFFIGVEIAIDVVTLAWIFIMGRLTYTVQDGDLTPQVGHEDLVEKVVPVDGSGPGLDDDMTGLGSQ